MRNISHHRPTRRLSRPWWSGVRCRPIRKKLVALPPTTDERELWRRPVPIELSFVTWEPTVEVTRGSAQADTSTTTGYGYDLGRASSSTVTVFTAVFRRVG